MCESCSASYFCNFSITLLSQTSQLNTHPKTVNQTKQSGAPGAWGPVVSHKSRRNSIDTYKKFPLLLQNVSKIRNGFYFFLARGKFAVCFTWRALVPFPLPQIIDLKICWFFSASRFLLFNLFKTAEVLFSNISCFCCGLVSKTAGLARKYFRCNDEFLPLRQSRNANPI